MFSERYLERFTAGMRSFIGVRMIRDTPEHGSVKKQKSISNSYLQAASLLLSLCVAYPNLTCFKFSIFPIQGNSWTQQCALLG